MKNERIPTQVNLWQLAEKSVKIAGELSLADMPRLQADLAKVDPADAMALFELKFGIDEDGRRYMQGNVKACLYLPCQRCLQATTYEVDHAFYLFLVHSIDEMESLGQERDAFLCDDEPMPLLDIIEEELLLSLPEVHMHAENECEIATEYVAKEKVKPNPFQKLADLKRDLGK